MKTLYTIIALTLVLFSNAQATDVDTFSDHHRFGSPGWSSFCEGQEYSEVSEWRKGYCMKISPLFKYESRLRSAEDRISTGCSYGKTKIDDYYSCYFGAPDEVAEKEVIPVKSTTLGWGIHCKDIEYAQATKEVREYCLDISPFFAFKIDFRKSCSECKIGEATTEK